MKVLVTGCSSAQTSESVSNKLTTFTGLFVQSLRESGHDVVWDTPSMRWDEEHLSQYDSVVIGLTAPTSITAYRLYGALSVIDKARSVSSVKYLVDAPEPHRLWNGIRAVAQNPEDLVKSFYSQRSEYSVAIGEKELSRIQSVVSGLYEEEWFDTIVPAFPWFRSHHITNHIPNLSENNIIPLCLDSLNFNNLHSTGLFMKSSPNGWSYDYNSKWLRKIEKTLSQEISPLIDSKKASNASVLSNMTKSIGTLVSVHKNDEPWWSVSLSQSLHVGTPVVTDWRHTSYLGDSWGTLGHAIEDMSDSERGALSVSQKKSYLEAIGSRKETIEKVSSVVFDK
jgi:hypothetical protein